MTHSHRCTRFCNVGCLCLTVSLGVTATDPGEALPGHSQWRHDRLYGGEYTLV